MENKKIEILNNILNAECYTIEISEEINSGDKIIKIESPCNKQIIYINMYELINLLKNYVAINKILLFDNEITTTDETIPF